MDRPLPKILNTIRQTKEAEIAACLQKQPLEAWHDAAHERLQTDTPRPFVKAVSAPGDVPNVIAEVKKASPSKGLIRPDFDPEAIARAYREAGAVAISCLTDEQYFQGSLDFLPLVREASGLPVMRKDFLIHPVQLYEACAAGADAVLLIARMLTAQELAALYVLATETLKMGVLMELHDDEDLQKALPIAPQLLGINNRDLDTFVVDTDLTYRMRDAIPQEIPLVAESGIHEHVQLVELSNAGIRAVLVGEHLMRQPDVADALRTLRGI